MPKFSKMELDQRAREYGFMRDTFEKVLRLKLILEFLNTNDFLKRHLLLKGGTAINLTVFSLPRLSVDIDLDYTPNDSREDMMNMRKQISVILQSYMESEEYILSSTSRYYHSLDSFYFSYVNSAGNQDLIKIEINYSLRAHILKDDIRELTTDAFGRNIEIRTVAPIEIYAAKANALLSRAAARDLYDFNRMVQSNMFSNELETLRKSIVFYAAISSETINKTFSTENVETITFQKIRRDLFPVLRQGDRTNRFDVEKKINEVKQYLSSLMTLTENEKEFMDRFEGKEYRPELLFEEEAVVRRIKNHPMALWKCRQ